MVLFLKGVNDGVEEVLSLPALSLPKELLHIHLQLQGHRYHRSTVLQLIKELVIYVLALSFVLE